MLFFSRLTEQIEMQIFVTVKFEKRKDKVVEKDSKYFVYVKSLPQKGDANREIVKEVAKYFRLSEENVKIIKGIKSHKKIIVIKDK